MSWVYYVLGLRYSGIQIFGVRDLGTEGNPPILLCACYRLVESSALASDIVLELLNDEFLVRDH